MNTREKIILACEQLAIKNALGFSRLSMEELAKAAGVSKRTIYRHFVSKEDLFEATIDKVTDEIIARNLRLSDSKDINTIIVGALQNISYLINPQFLADLSHHYPMLWQKIDQIRQKKIDRLIDHLLVSSKLRLRVDSGIFKTSLLTAMSEILSPEFILKSGMSFEQVGLEFLNMFIFGAVEPLSNTKQEASLANLTELKVNLADEQNGQKLQKH
ncbi:MAG: TetR/AcrR family transcriptional regulator [Dehalobacter sp. 4CP]|uniref:TetR/AcrR family transcriptional regulator n=1 Tax=Dehalobacter sp. CP TaxID=2594474 RepID=UPI0013CCC6A8|nr:TetR/AcrR family transcriptional regulator [Dehalobacter sp.]NBJ16027.1 TetR/AcrR family transcriptional regulator [Dehalobacter sp. 4CP]